MIKSIHANICPSTSLQGPCMIDYSLKSSQCNICSGGSLPLIVCIQVRSGPIYWGAIYLAEKITCDGISHVILFHYSKTPYIICKSFTKFIYNEYIRP